MLPVRERHLLNRKLLDKVKWTKRHLRKLVDVCSRRVGKSSLAGMIRFSNRGMPRQYIRCVSRRLRATLDAYEGCAKPKPFKGVYRQVKKLADNLGSERDADVMLQELRT